MEQTITLFLHFINPILCQVAQQLEVLALRSRRVKDELECSACLRKLQVRNLSVRFGVTIVTGCDRDIFVFDGKDVGRDQRTFPCGNLSLRDFVPYVPRWLSVRSTVFEVHLPMHDEPDWRANSLTVLAFH